MVLRASRPVVHPDPAPVVAAPAPAPAPAPAAPAPAAAQGPAPAAAPAQGAAPAVVPAQGPAPLPPPAAAPAQGQQGDANEGPEAPPGVLMRDIPLAPGTRSGLGIRLAQASLAAAAVGTMASTDDYASITAFRYFVAAAALQCMWSLTIAIVDVYALLVGRSFRTLRAVGILSFGDWITGALSLSAASASAAITILINDDLEFCYENPCPSFMSATAMSFLSWFALAPCCVLNLGQVIYKLQRP